MLDWLRLPGEALRLNLAQSRHRRRLRRARHALGTLPHAAALRPAPCQSASDSGRAGHTRCEACQRFDRASRYRLLCPRLAFVAGEARCTADAAAVRPHWGRAAALLLGPLLALHVVGALGFWAVLRHQGLRSLSPVDTLLPHRWETISEHRRRHFRDLALSDLAAGDFRGATVALFSAAHSGEGPPSDNIALARLATLGGYHSLADELHAANLAAHPAEAEALAVAWHDDLLLADRPERLARLALERLARAGADREFWLRAFFESIRHRDVAAQLLADPALKLPHDGLRHALAARAALAAPARDPDHLEARDQLLALEAFPPGAATRRFLALAWRDIGEPVRALTIANDPRHAALPGDAPCLRYTLLRRLGRHEDARLVLRPLLASPAEPLREHGLAALIADPDTELAREVLSAPVMRSPVAGDARRHHALRWLVARRAGLVDLAELEAAALAGLAQPIPEPLLASNLTTRERGPLGLAAATLSVSREALLALRDPAPAALIP